MQHDSNPKRGKKRAAPPLWWVAACILLAACADTPESDVATVSPATYVDESTCVDCHGAYVESWTGSHHDLAMQPASSATVLGDMDDAVFRGAAGSTHFVTRGDTFLMRSLGPDGAVAEYPVTDVFGIDPLQQLVVDIGGGRRQVTTIAWDPGAERWFETQPGMPLDHTDELHWSQPAHNWNFMCAECHATGLQRRYNAGTNTYATTAHRFDVGCQACHGPASRHVENMRVESTDDPGLTIDLSTSSRIQIETCGRCHSRRAPLDDGYDVSRSLHDDYRVSLLDENLYYADGQIKDEVYVYGSFLQSRMHAVGMRCTDCHDPHTAAPKIDGDALCITCHNPSAPAAADHINVAGLQKKRYDDPEHHRHPMGEGTPTCMDCHAPATNYMVVDPRHDHSFRIPRPDLSLWFGTPNACTQCHADRTSTWAAEQVESWYGTDHPWHYVEAIAAGRAGSTNAPAVLRRVIDDLKQPAIVRATAIDLLGRFPGPDVQQALRANLNDPHPLVRRAAVSAHEPLDPRTTRYLLDLLDDPVRSVRMSVVPVMDLSERTPRVEAALREYEELQTSIGGFGDGPLNLGSLRQRQGRLDEAERLYRQSLRENPHFTPAVVNLADVVRYRSEPEAETILREGIQRQPDEAVLHYALSLSLIRQKRIEAAREAMARAVQLAPDVTSYAETLRLIDESLGRATP